MGAARPPEGAHTAAEGAGAPVSAAASHAEADGTVLQVQRAEGVWTLTLNRPDKLNALDAQLVDALLQAVASANAQGARLLILRGAGKSFSAGFDLSGLQAQSEGDLLLRFVRIEMLLQAIAQSPAQTLALAHGKVFGAGVDLLAVCRHRIASPDTLLRMPGLQFGLVLGTRRFGAIVGAERARAVLESGQGFSAGQAHAMGFVTRVADMAAWPAIIEEVDAAAAALEDITRAELYRVLGPVNANEDLATLTRSAARPGLKQRLQAYLGRAR